MKLLPQSHPNRAQISTPLLLLGRHTLHHRPVSLEQQRLELILFRPRIPHGRPRFAESVRVFRADETRPVALHNGHDACIHAAYAVARW
jgi:hypothetical protein